MLRSRRSAVVVADAALAGRGWPPPFRNRARVAHARGLTHKSLDDRRRPRAASALLEKRGPQGSRCILEADCAEGHPSSRAQVLSGPRTRHRRVRAGDPVLRFGDPRVEADTLCETLLATTGITNRNLRALMTRLLTPTSDLRPSALRAWGNAAAHHRPAHQRLHHQGPPRPSRVKLDTIHQKLATRIARERPLSTAK